MNKLCELFVASVLGTGDGAAKGGIDQHPPTEFGGYGFELAVASVLGTGGVSAEGGIDQHPQTEFGGYSFELAVASVLGTGDEFLVSVQEDLGGAA